MVFRDYLIWQKIQRANQKQDQGDRPTDLLKDQGPKNADSQGSSKLL